MRHPTHAKMWDVIPNRLLDVRWGYPSAARTDSAGRQPLKPSFLLVGL